VGCRSHDVARGRVGDGRAAEGCFTLLRVKSPPAFPNRPSRGLHPRASLRRYPNPSCDACPVPATVALRRTVGAARAVGKAWPWGPPWRCSWPAPWQRTGSSTGWGGARTRSRRGANEGSVTDSCAMTPWRQGAHASRALSRKALAGTHHTHHIAMQQVVMQSCAASMTPLDKLGPSLTGRRRISTVICYASILRRIAGGGQVPQNRPFLGWTDNFSLLPLHGDPPVDRGSLLIR
jgi:hypothetical protein